MDDPNYGRTIVDPLTQKEIVLTDEEVQMIQAIQGGEFPDSAIDPYEDYIDFFTHEKRVTPVSSAPEPKSRFVPSKWEHKAIMKFVRAIRKGWLKPKKDETKEPEFFDLWKQNQATGNAQNKRLTHIAAPKMSLPGHAESYNPPVEYVPTAEERKEWYRPRRVCCLCTVCECAERTCAGTLLRSTAEGVIAVVCLCAAVSWPVLESM